MNTQGIIVLIIAVVVVFGGVWYFSSNKGVPSSGTPTTQNATTGSGTLAALSAMTGSFTCTVSSGTADTQSSGVVYLSDGQMRGDFTMTTKATGSTPIDAHMIKAGGFMYSWSSATPQGVKIADSAMPQGSAATASKGGVDPNTQVTYSCTPWTADVTKFAPPETVTFMDVSAMMKNVPTGAMPVKGTTYPTGPTTKPYNY